MAYFESLACVVAMVESEVYSGFERIARQRLARRDENDWPIRCIDDHPCIPSSP